MFRLLISLLVSTMSLAILANKQDCFSLKSIGYQTESYPVDITVASGHTCSIPFQFVGVLGCSVDGDITRTHKNYLVRILLKAKSGKEYLIMESMKEVRDESFYAFSDYCEETILLNSVTPDSIKIVAIGAEVRINKITIVKNNDFNSKLIGQRLSKSEEVHLLQVQNVIDRINSYNINHNKLWIAGITPLSLKRYDEKKRIMGLTDETCTWGEEYYYDGIFEFGEFDDAVLNRDSTLSYIDCFDWRNCHGKNWITSNKDQGDSGYCSAFTAISGIEAMTRLYYNKLLDVDLSEQEAACCNGVTNVWHNGMPVYSPLEYAKNFGVCDEIAYPFVNDSLASLICRSSEITPNELVKIGGYASVTKTENSMKHNIIEHGPLCSSVSYWNYRHDSFGNPVLNQFGDTIKDYVNHAMLIVGYGCLELGDTVYYYVHPNGMGDGHHKVREGDPHIGMTYWIYKDNYGDYGPRHGYRYYIHHDYSTSVGNTYYIQPVIQSTNYTDSDVVCEDADGDGYYFWGLGEKPSFCPSWVPDIADGDDHDHSKGKLYLEAPNVIGSFENLYPDSNTPVTISGNTVYNSHQSVYSHISISSNASLTVTDTLNLFGRVNITIESGGQLIIDGGIITNANIVLSSGGKLEIKNGGKLIMRTGTDFYAPVGALVDITYGEIIRSNDFFSN